MTNYIVELLEDSGLWEPIGCYSDLGQTQDIADTIPEHTRIVEEREEPQDIADTIPEHTRVVEDPEKSPRFRVERWFGGHGWECIVQEHEWGWAEVAVYTGLALYDGDYRVVDTKTGTCKYYRRGQE